MPFQIIREDILNIKSDAIVNPTDNLFSHKGGTDKQIHDAAGEELYKACIANTFLGTGEAIITPAFNLSNAKYIIHTCGPIYKNGKFGENDYLYSCYKKSLDLAKTNKVESIAFPLISSGQFSFPKGEALRIATSAITDFLKNNEMYIYLLIYENSVFDNSKQVFNTIKKQIKDAKPRKDKQDNLFTLPGKLFGAVTNQEVELFEEKECCVSLDSLEVPIKDEAFHEYLQRVVKERNLTDPEVYKKANMDRKLWNNIINGKKKGIRKETAVSIALALEMNLDETKELIERSGLAFADYSLFDRIIKACINDKIYNIFDVNEVLLAYDQVTLGSKARED